MVTLSPAGGARLETAKMLELSNGVNIELLQRNNLFSGLGRVEVNGVPLRGSRRPMFVEVRTPEGEEFFDFELHKKRETADGFVLDFSMKARSAGMQDWMAHAVRNLYPARDWAEREWTPASTGLRMHLRAITDTFCGRIFRAETGDAIQIILRQRRLRWVCGRLFAAIPVLLNPTDLQGARPGKATAAEDQVVGVYHGIGIPLPARQWHTR